MKKLDFPLRALARLLAVFFLLPFSAAAAPGDLDNFSFGANDRVHGLAVQPDRKFLWAGQFTEPNTLLARLQRDDAFETGFNPQFSLDVLYCTSVRYDEKVMAGGVFTSVNSVVRRHLARIDSNGALDTNFSVTMNGGTHSVIPLPDGQMLIGGAWSILTGGKMGLGRLYADGTVNTNFVANTDHNVHSLALQDDEKILVGGMFGTISGLTRTRIGRLNADSTVDTNFNPVVNVQVNCLAVQADGKILVGGNYTFLAGSRTNIGRLNLNGTLDTNFNISASGAVNTLAVQADGRILVGGLFTNIAGAPRSYLARLNSNGTIDTNFNPVLDNEVFGVALQADGSILVGGRFQNVNGLPRGNFARLQNDPATESLTISSSNRVEWLRGGSAPESQYVTFDLSTNGGATYVSLGKATRISGGWELTGLSLPDRGHLRARAQTSGGYRCGSHGLVETVLVFGDVPEIAVFLGSIANPVHERVDNLGTNDILSVVNDSGIAQTFTIKNIGNTNLTGLALAVTGTNSSYFTVSAPGTNTLAPGATTSFTVTFTTTTVDTRNAVVTIASNDENENPFELKMKGVGLIFPQPVISRESLKFSNGVFQFSFTNSIITAYRVVAATDVTLPVSNWNVLGFATNMGGGLFQFADPEASNYPVRYYRVRYP